MQGRTAEAVNINMSSMDPSVDDATGMFDPDVDAHELVKLMQWALL
jgi:hypothetical protein